MGSRIILISLFVVCLSLAIHGYAVVQEDHYNSVNSLQNEDFRQAPESTFLERIQHMVEPFRTLSVRDALAEAARRITALFVPPQALETARSGKGYVLRPEIAAMVTRAVNTVYDMLSPYFEI